MPVYFRNRSSDINYGVIPIEKMGGNKITYSMYGDNIPTITIEPSGQWIRPNLSENDLPPIIQYIDYSNRYTKYFLGGDYFAVESSSTWDSSTRGIYNAFDETYDLSTYDLLLLGHELPAYITFYNPDPLKVYQIRWYSNDEDETYPSDYTRVEKYTIQASNDNIHWVSIHDGTVDLESCISDGYFDINVNSSDFYKYYKIIIESLYGSGFRLRSHVIACNELKIVADYQSKIILGNFIQPIFTPSENEYQICNALYKDGFTISGDSIMNNSGIGWTVNGNNYCDKWGLYGPFGWHSNSGYPHYITFEYENPLILKNITIYNSGINATINDYEIEYENNGDWVKIKEGNNSINSVLTAWDIELKDNTVSSNRWRIKVLNGSGQSVGGSDHQFYLTISKIKIDAEVIESENKPFIQPCISSLDNNFNSTSLTKDNFTIYADSIFNGKGIGQAFDRMPRPDISYWHSNSGYPHHIGFKYDKPLNVKKLTIANANANVVAKDYVIQYLDNGEYVDLLSGTNDIITKGDKWDIKLPGNISSTDWRIKFISGSGIDGNNYVAVSNVEIYADVVE